MTINRAAVVAGILIAIDARPCLAADGATVKLRDGKVVTGKVQGQLVLKDVPFTHVRGQDEIHLVRYTMVSGNAVLAIDERGVQLDGPSIRFAVAAQSGSALDDAKIFKALCDSMGAAGGSLMPLNDKGSLAMGSRALSLGGLSGYVGLHAPTARLAARLAGAQSEIFDIGVRRTHKETDKKTLLLPDEVVGSVHPPKGGGKGLGLCYLGGDLALAGPSATTVPIANLAVRTPPPAPDALGGLEADIILARRLDEFFVRDIEVNADAFSMSIVQTKKDEPPFEHVVVGSLSVERVEAPAGAAAAFEAALIRQVSKRGFKSVSTASAGSAPQGRVLEFSALVIPRVTRPVIALKGVDRSKGEVVYAMAVPLYQVAHKGDLVKGLAEAMIHFARYIKPRL